MKPGEYYQGSADNLRCYLPFYTYSVEPRYIAAVCSSENHSIALARISGLEVLKVSYNHPVDLVAFGIMFVSVVVAWTIFLYRKVSQYVPGL